MRLQTAIYAFLGMLVTCALSGCNGDSGEPDGQPPTDLTRPVVSAEAVLALLPGEGPGTGWVIQEGEGWAAVGEALYERIDGAAEAYIQYDFKAAARRHLIRGTDVNTYIEVTIYEFGSPAEAFGAYSVISGLAGEALADLGDAAVYDEGTLFMWQDVYLVHVVASDVGEDIAAAQRQMASTIGRNIQREAAGLPAIFDLLPKAGRLPGTERYAHTALSVTRIEPGFATKPLALSQETEVAVADYGPAADTPETERNRVFLIRYPTAEAAARAYQAYGADAAAAEGRVGKQTVIEQQGAHIVGSWRKATEGRAPMVPEIVWRLKAQAAAG